MAKGGYLGVGGKARKIKKGYIGIGGTARKIKKGYIGVGGVARLIYNNAFELPTFTGNSMVYGNATKGRIELLSSGTLTISSGNYDICIINGGANSSKDTFITIGASPCGGSPTDIVTGSTGGRGGNQCSFYGKNIQSETVTVVIGAGGGLSYLSGGISLKAEDGAIAYSNGAKYTLDAETGAESKAAAGSNGSPGNGRTTKPFSGDSSEFSTPLSAGGGAYFNYAGGNYGGGDYNRDGIANTGGGAGGNNHIGGSGKIIIRWGY